MKLALQASIAALLLLPVAARAQGTLSTQGFGYPDGALGARAFGMGGSIAEGDPLSAVNPAAVGLNGRTGLFLQIAPEFRTVNSPGGGDHATVVRFPLLGLAFNVGPRTSVAFTATSMLDRTWRTQRTGIDTAATGDTTTFTEAFKSTGSITDLRLAVAHQLFTTLRVGLAGHVLTGQNQLSAARSETDSLSSGFQQNTTYSYNGTGISGGVEWAPFRFIELAASGRVGGHVRSFRRDSLQTEANAPKVAGAGIQLVPVAGLLLAGRAEWTGWSSLQGLGVGETFVARDAWDYGVGAEVRGPGLFGTDIPLRVGYRHRTLPFEAAESMVTEKSITFGFGFLLARGRSRFDVGIAHATRTAPSVAFNETAWTLSAGVNIRP